MSAVRGLLVEDDPAIVTVVRGALEDADFHVSACSSVAERDAALHEASFDVLVTDVMLGDGDGIASLDAVRTDHPDLPIIVMSAQNTLDTAVRANETSAYEYFPKPFDLDDLVASVTAACAAQSQKKGNTPPQGDMPLIGRSPAMQGVYRLIARLLDNDLTVLITGESGTGKELVAEAIHSLGHRKAGPFIAINAAAIPAELIESELFGHEKGAFTGAVSRQLGKFEQADGGTLFLDEIGDMPMAAQTRLLRALQSRTIQRVGGNQAIPVDARILAATHRDLTGMIAEGSFREDLYYRLNVLPIALPPLRDRRDDIPLLARHFLDQAPDEGLPHCSLSDTGADWLRKHDWPGNVRELRNVMLRGALLSRSDLIDARALASALDGDTPRKSVAPGNATFADALAAWLESVPPLGEGTLHARALAAFEKPLYEYALVQTGGNQLKAAALLGINRNTLRKRLFDLAIDPDNFVAR